MRHQNSVFHSVQKHVPWDWFDRLVDEHQADARVRRLTTKGQFVALLYGQLSGAAGLREIVTGLESHARRLYHVGADVVRTVMLSGRRYETFGSIAEFRRFAETSTHSLRAAAGVVARHGVRLAVENHKDWRADELLRILNQVGNDHVGVCLDTGNSIALLEDPMEVVEVLAPRAVTTHFKDMALEESKQGFLLSEVPLGTGVLDLPRVIRVLRAARPEIRLNLEMITRDPLEVPCLTQGYWATFPDLPGKDVARALSFVRGHPPERPLPRISQLPRDEQLRAEDDNVRRCLAFARDRLVF